VQSEPHLPSFLVCPPVRRSSALTGLISNLRADSFVSAPPASLRLASPRQTYAPPKNSLIRYCKTTRDYLVPSVWGPIQKGEDPYAPQPSGGVSPLSLSSYSIIAGKSPRLPHTDLLCVVEHLLITVLRDPITSSPSLSFGPRSPSRTLFHSGPSSTPSVTASLSGPLYPLHAFATTRHPHSLAFNPLSLSSFLHPSSSFLLLYPPFPPLTILSCSI
jgi:hypothetical protein